MASEGQFSLAKFAPGLKLDLQNTFVLKIIKTFYSFVFLIILNKSIRCSFRWNVQLQTQFTFQKLILCNERQNLNMLFSMVSRLPLPTLTPLSAARPTTRRRLPGPTPSWTRRGCQPFSSASSSSSTVHSEVWP